MYLYMLICVTTCGIIFSIYAADNLFQYLNQETYGLQFIPEFEFLADQTRFDFPFSGNFFIVTIGYAIVLIFSILLYSVDLENYHLF